MPTYENLSETEINDLVSNWQRCLPEDIPNLFLAYNREKDEQKRIKNQTERVVSYCVSTTDIGRLLDAYKKLMKEVPKKPEKNEGVRFVIHLGVSNSYKEYQIPSNPHFKLMIEVVKSLKEIGTFDNCVILDWYPNPSFTIATEKSSNSDIDSIPGASAFLFVHSWIETPHHDLGTPFEATPYLLGQRVKNYVFSVGESKQINKSLSKVADRGNNQPVNESARLLIHLGRGISVSTHPFDFRPVIEITKLNKGNKGLMRLSDNDSDNELPAYYDFSLPEPPPIDPEQ